MTALALFNALQDFGARPARAPEPVRAAPPAPPRPDTAALIADAVAGAEASLRERLEAEHAQALQALRDGHAAELAEVERRCGSEMGLALAAALASAEARLQEAIAGPVARILASLAAEDLARRAVEHLAVTVTEAVRGRGTLRIAVSGPAPFCDALAAKLGTAGAEVETRRGEGPDVSVDIDGSIVETRIADWGSQLAEIAR